jgi:hypothetical protein
MSAASHKLIGALAWLLVALLMLIAGITVLHEKARVCRIEARVAMQKGETMRCSFGILTATPLIAAVSLQYASAQALQDQAIQRCWEKLEPHWLQRGEDWFTKTRSSDAKSTDGLMQLRGKELMINSEELTEADKLNGKEWGGLVTYRARVMRQVIDVNDNSKGQDHVAQKWGSWTDGGTLGACRASFIKGTWHVNTNYVDERTLYRPTPESVEEAERLPSM